MAMLLTQAGNFYTATDPKFAEPISIRIEVYSEDECVRRAVTDRIVDAVNRHALQCHGEKEGLTK